MCYLGGAEISVHWAAIIPELVSGDNGCSIWHLQAFYLESPVVEGGARLKVVVVGFAYRDLLIISDHAIRRGRRNLAGLASGLHTHRLAGSKM